MSRKFRKSIVFAKEIIIVIYGVNRVKARVKNMAAWLKFRGLYLFNKNTNDHIVVDINE